MSDYLLQHFQGLYGTTLFEQTSLVKILPFAGKTRWRGRGRKGKPRVGHPQLECNMLKHLRPERITRIVMTEGCT
jgi:hypothetical protein